MVHVLSCCGNLDLSKLSICHGCLYWSCTQAGEAIGDRCHPVLPDAFGATVTYYYFLLGQALPRSAKAGGSPCLIGTPTLGGA